MTKYEALLTAIAELEKMILCACIDDTDGNMLDCDLSECDFSKTHIVLFQYLHTCAVEKIPKNILSLTASGELTNAYINDVTNYWTPPANMKADVAKLRKLKRARSWYEYINENSSEILSPPDYDIDSFLDGIHRRELLEIERSGLRHQSIVMTEAVQQIEEIQTGDRIGKYSVGHDKLDPFGPEPNALVLLAADSSNGKSLVASYMARHFAAHNIPTLFVSLEMSDVEIMMRALAEAAATNVENLKTPNTLSAHHYDRIFEYVGLHRTKPLFFERMQTTSAIISSIARYKHKHGIKAVFIDYIQNLQFRHSTDRFDLEEQAAIVELYEASKKYDVAIIALSQVRKRQSHQSAQAPRISDVKGSGAYRASADHLWLLHRPGYGSEDIEDNTLQITIAKNRQGPTGQVINIAFENGRLPEWRI